MSFQTMESPPDVSQTANLKTRLNGPILEIDCEVYRGFEACSKIKEEWDCFVEAMNGEIFITYDWCRIWWKHYGKGRELLIIVFRRHREIVGVLPIFQERIWMGPIFLRAVKIVGTDFSPITLSIPIRNECLYEAVAALRQLLDNEWEWDIIRFGALAGNYESVDLLANCLSKTFSDRHLEVKNEDRQIYLRLEPDWEAYVRTLSGKQRTNARRAFRDLEARGVNLGSSLVKTESLDSSFDQFVQMHQAYWNSLLKPGHFKAWPKAFEFHREQAQFHLQKDRLRLLKITFNNECVDYEYFYKIGTTYFWFINGRSSEVYKSGVDFKWIDLRTKLELAAKEGVTIIDSMRGDYDYKALMGGKSLPVKAIFVSKARGLAGVRIRMFRSLAWVLDIAYAKIWRRRVAPKLHYKVGSFWITWIRSHMLSI